MLKKEKISFMHILIPDPARGGETRPPFLKKSPPWEKFLSSLEIRDTSSEALAESLPFSGGDATAGAENELQAVVLGEGVGRLACISFGCCYGKPPAESHPFLQKIFARWNFIFSGKTKKIACAHGLDGHRVIPIQAITAILYSAVSLLGLFLFLKGWPRAAFLLCLLVTQTWRAVSEFFRADYRGGGGVSAYQVMAIFSIAYGFLLAGVLPSPPHHPRDLWTGLNVLCSAGMLLFPQGIWAATFFLTGRNMVTASNISFHVVKERV